MTPTPSNLVVSFKGTTAEGFILTHSRPISQRSQVLPQASQSFWPLIPVLALRLVGGRLGIGGGGQHSIWTPEHTAVNAGITTPKWTPMEWTKACGPFPDGLIWRNLDTERCIVWPPRSYGALVSSGSWLQHTLEVSMARVWRGGQAGSIHVFLQGLHGG